MFTVTGTSTGMGVGIVLSSVSNCHILNNTANDNYIGIWLSFSSANTITGNTANENFVGGIYLDHSSGNTVTDNNASHNGNSSTPLSLGIGMEYSSNNNISGNTMTYIYYGIALFSHSDNNKVTGNTVLVSNFDDPDNVSFNDTHCGIALSLFSDNNEVNFRQEFPDNSATVRKLVHKIVFGNPQGLDWVGIAAGNNIIQIQYRDEVAAGNSRLTRNHLIAIQTGRAGLKITRNSCKCVDCPESEVSVKGPLHPHATVYHIRERYFLPSG